MSSESTGDAPQADEVPEADERGIGQPAADPSDHAYEVPRRRHDDVPPQRSGGGGLKGMVTDIGQPTARGIIPTLVVCGLVFAILGGLVSSFTGASYTATALVQGAPVSFDPSATSDTDLSYVQTEVAYIRIDKADLQNAVAKKTGISDPAPVDVAVIPGTTILAFTGSGSNPTQAAANANISAETYIQSWRARVTSTLKDSIEILDKQLATNPPNAAALSNQRAALQTKLDAATSINRLIKRATPEGASKSSSALTGALLGGLVGLLVGVGVLLLARRRRSRNTAGD